MPEKFIWRTAVAVHCLPRTVLFASVIHKYYKNTEIGKRYTSTTWWFGLLNLLNYILQVVENGGLITLSYVSSTDNLGKIFYKATMLRVKCWFFPVIELIELNGEWDVSSLFYYYYVLISFSCPWRFVRCLHVVCYVLHASVLYFILVDCKEANQCPGTKQTS